MNNWFGTGLHRRWYYRSPNGETKSYGVADGDGEADIDESDELESEDFFFVLDDLDLLVVDDDLDLVPSDFMFEPFLFMSFFADVDAAELEVVVVAVSVLF